MEDGIMILWFTMCSWQYFYSEEWMVHLSLQAVILDFLWSGNLNTQIIFSECNHNEYVMYIL